MWNTLKHHKQPVFVNLWFPCVSASAVTDASVSVPQAGFQILQCLLQSDLSSDSGAF